MACARTAVIDPAPPLVTTDATAPETGAFAADAALVDSAEAGWSPSSAAIDGPHQDLSLEPGRPIFYALPRGGPRPVRLVGHLHGMCGPPS